MEFGSTKLSIHHPILFMASQFVQKQSVPDSDSPDFTLVSATKPKNQRTQHY
jgi:hypothetical protein